MGAVTEQFPGITLVGMNYRDFAQNTNMDQGAVELLQHRTRDSRFNTR